MSLNGGDFDINELDFDLGVDDNEDSEHGGTMDIEIDYTDIGDVYSGKDIGEIKEIISEQNKEISKLKDEIDYLKNMSRSDNDAIRDDVIQVLGEIFSDSDEGDSEEGEDDLINQIREIVNSRLDNDTYIIKMYKLDEAIKSIGVALDSLTEENEEIRSSVSKVNETITYMGSALPEWVKGGIEELESKIEQMESKIETIKSSDKDNIRDVFDKKIVDELNALEGRVLKMWDFMQSRLGNVSNNGIDANSIKDIVNDCLNDSSIINSLSDRITNIEKSKLNIDIDNIKSEIKFIKESLSDAVEQSKKVSCGGLDKEPKNGNEEHKINSKEKRQEMYRTMSEDMLVKNIRNYLIAVGIREKAVKKSVLEDEFTSEIINGLVVKNKLIAVGRDAITIGKEV